MPAYRQPVLLRGDSGSGVPGRLLVVLQEQLRSGLHTTTLCWMQPELPEG